MTIDQESKQVKKLAESFIARVRKVTPSETNPRLIAEIVNNLKLEPIVEGEESLKKFLAAAQLEAKDAAPLLGVVEEAILNNPPMCQLLAYIEENNLVSDEELRKASDTITLQINTLYILEAFAVTMLNSNTFNEEICKTLLKDRLPNHPLYNLLFTMDKDASLFKKLKIVSTDAYMIASAFSKKMGSKEGSLQEEANAFRGKYALKSLNANITPEKVGEQKTNTLKGVALNIVEACWQESQSGKANAEAGAGLIGIMEDRNYTNFDAIEEHVLPRSEFLSTDGHYTLLPDLLVNTRPKRVNKFNADDEWNKLYGTWNAEFVIREIDKTFLPLKLLVPSVIAAQPEYYIEARALCLFCALTSIWPIK